MYPVLLWGLAGCNALLGNEPGYLLVDAEASLDFVDAAANGGTGGTLPTGDANAQGGGTAEGTDATGGGAARTDGGASTAVETSTVETNSTTSGSTGSGTEPQSDGSGTTCASDATEEACRNAECAPGMETTRSVACSCGGQKQQVRSCNDDCVWNGWRDTTACSVACCSEVVFCNTQENAAAAAQYPNRGTWCRRTSAECSSAEVRADCEADVNHPDVCDGRFVEEFIIED